MERFEDRLLLSGAPLSPGPQLVSITTNNGDIVYAPNNTAPVVLHTAPDQLTFQFSGGQVIDPATLGGIELVRAGGDHRLGDADDVTITPGFIGIGATPNQVVMRFSSTLPDDLYQITLLGSGANELANTDSPPDPFNSGNSLAPNLQVDFTLDTPPQVVSVVPEPVTRNAAGQLQQATDEIDVYFNKGIQPLPATINQLDPKLFQLIVTGDTANPTSDLVVNPSSVSFNFTTDMATLLFLDGQGNPNPIGNFGSGAFRLRIGNDQIGPLQPDLPQPNTTPIDVSPGTTFGDPATLSQDPGPYVVGDLNTIGSEILTSRIGPAAINPNVQFPGGPTGPGQGDVPDGLQSNFDPAALAALDSAIVKGTAAPIAPPGQITVYTYNFPDEYGSVPGNPVLHNAITAQQEQLTREIFQLYSHYLGVQFEEVSSTRMGAANLGIVNGVVQALGASLPTDLNGHASPFNASGERLAIMNAVVFTSDPGEYGGPWFKTAMHEIGLLLGLANNYTSPPGNIMGSGTEANDQLPSQAGGEPVFPGNTDIQSGQYLYRPQSDQVGMYKFEVTTPGTFSAETIAQRLPNPSLLNSVLTLYNQANVIQLPKTGANPIGAGSIINGSTFTLNDGIHPAVTFEYNSGLVINVPNRGGAAVTDGEEFAINDGTNLVFFQFYVNNPVPSNLPPDTVAIQVSPGATAAQLAGSVAAAIQTAVAEFGLGVVTIGTTQLDEIVPSAYNGQVYLGGTVNTTVDVSGAPGFSQSGQATPFYLGDVVIRFAPGETSETVAKAIAAAVNANVLTTGLDVTAAAQFDQVVLGGPVTVSNSANQGSVTYSLSRQVIARNDDYFGNDSYIKLRLDPGYYYVAVSSTGDTNFDPNVPNSGSGGTTEGAYQLRLSFDPLPVRNLTDQVGFTLSVPTGTAGFKDGESFTITDGRQRASFDFYVTVAPPAHPAPGHFPIQLAADETADQIAAQIAAAVAAADLSGLTPVSSGATVSLGSTPTTSVNVQGTPLVLQGRAVGNVLQGNSDGLTGGAYDFWFNVGNTIFVDKQNASPIPTSPPNPNLPNLLGLIDDPFNTIGQALQTAADRIVLPFGSLAPSFLDGQTFIVNDGVDPPLTFEFALNNRPLTDGNTPISFTAGDSGATLAAEIDAAITQAANNGKLQLTPSATGNVVDVSTVDANGGLVSLNGSPGPSSGPAIDVLIDVNGASFLDLHNAPYLQATPNVVRIVGPADANSGDNALGVLNPPGIGYTQTFSITAGTETVTFEFAKTGTTVTAAGQLADGNYAVLFPVGANSQQIATAMVAAVNASPLAQLAGGSVTASLTNDATGWQVQLSGVGTIVTDAQGTPSLVAPSNTQAYLIGTDPFTGAPLADGATFVVPQNVTVLIDAGAVLKFRGANIDVGLSSPNINRNGAALQVLGTPTSSVFLTSYSDDSIGQTTNTVSPPAPGDWGGIAFVPGADLEQDAVFLDSVDHADLRYGGGSVNVNGVSAVFNPIYINGSRPTIAFDTISYTHDSAMSADPNSFTETVFGSGAVDPSTGRAQAPFSIDYERAGPDVYGNVLAYDQPGARTIDAVPATQLLEGESFTITNPNNGATLTFEFTTDGNVVTGDVPVTFTLPNATNGTLGDTAAIVAASIAAAIDGATLPNGAPFGVTATVNPANSSQVLISGMSSTSGITLTTPQIFTAVPASDLADGETFTIVNPDTRTITTFEFDDDGSVTRGNIAVTFTSGDSDTQVAAEMAAAINNAGVGASALVIGNQVLLYGASSLIFTKITANIASSSNSLTLVPGSTLNDAGTFTIVNNHTGASTTFEFDDDPNPTTNAPTVVAGNVPIEFSTSDTDAQVAAETAAAINAAHLGVTVIVDGNQVVIIGLTDVTFGNPLTLVSNVVANTVNGLFVRTVNVPGESPEALSVFARWTATDIPYVVSDNLTIQGNPGGLLDGQARYSGRLEIDPGAVVKLNGLRIEVGMGANFIAEGTAAQPIVFTSLADNTVGGGGTFQTNSIGSNPNFDVLPSVPAPGDWGGIYFSPTSLGSLDHAQLSYGGGQTPVAGQTDNFNVVEVRQAQVRIADSTLSNNAAGVALGDRGGLGTNDPAVIFVLGAQPVIVNNVIENNRGDAINIDVNSLNSDLTPDWGRSTGAVGSFTQFADNYGPLVALNRLDSNVINGMVVRGGTLDTNSIWDDTDIVHVVLNQISVPNNYTLKLESSPAASLVVKLQGATAGFTATGTPMDLNNRIGGAVQVLGTPQHRVVLTGLADSTVGAGLTPDGRPQNNTQNSGFSVNVGPNVNITPFSGNHQETTIAVNPTNPLNLFEADTLSKVGRYSLDGGKTWATSDLSAVPTDSSVGADVQAAWDSFGNLFITWFGPKTTIVVARSSDGGKSFKDARTVESSGSDDQPSIAVGPSGTSAAGSVWVKWTDSKNEVVIDGAPVNGFDSVGAFGKAEIAPGPGGDFGSIAVGPQGQVMVSYQNNGSGNGPDTIKVNVDPDGLGPLGVQPVVIATSTNVGGFTPIPPQPDRTIDAEPKLAFDRSGGQHNGRVYLVYVDRPSTSSVETSIYVRFSDDNGATWSNPVRVNDNPVGDGKSTLQPAIAVDQSTGYVAVTWYDARNSGPADDTVQVFGSVSTDGGLTWLPNFQISAGTSNGTVAASGGFNFGDYDTMSIAYQNGTFYRSWADNSNSTGDNPAGALNTFDVYTAPVTITPGGVSVAAPGSWNGVTLDQYSNDTNIAVINKAEIVGPGSSDSDATPFGAQPLGTLAPNPKSGDDSQRLGFVVNGSIPAGNLGDVDTYSFQATAGTQVWFTIGNTSPALDTVLELVDANGTVLARSDNAAAEAANPALLANEGLTTNLARPLQDSTSSPPGIYSPLSTTFAGLRNYASSNPLDAGFRAVLPNLSGSNTGLNTYYIRVRSKGNADFSNLSAGRSSGVYTLQIGLQELEQTAGSSIQYADIRAATNGVTVLGQPADSPLLGESAGNGNNHSFATAQDLGNVLQTNQSTVSVADNLPTATTVDWFKIEVDYNLVQAIAGLNNGTKTWPAIFDVNYADGLSRPNTTISIFDSTGTLIYTGRDSNVADSQPAPNTGNDLSDLTHGSVGQLDPYIGSIQLPAAVGGATQTYYVAISSDATLPTALNATFTAAASQPLIRLEPIDSLNYVVDDHIGVQGGNTAQDPNTLTPAFNGNTTSAAGIAQLNSYAVPFNLGNVVLFVDQGGQNGHLETVNPLTGALETNVGQTAGQGAGYDDIAMRNDGGLYGFALVPPGAPPPTLQDRLDQINTGTAAATVVGADGIVPYKLNAAGAAVKNVNTGVQFHAMAFRQDGPNGRILYAVGSYTDDNGRTWFNNGLYEFNGDTGALITPATGTAQVPTNPFPDAEIQFSGGPGGIITGLAVMPNGLLYGVTNRGGLYVITGAAATFIASPDGPVTFSSLSAGPPDLNPNPVTGIGQYANMMFAMDSSGNLYAFDEAGAPQNVFQSAANPSGPLVSSIPTGVSGITGMAFSTLDYNLWHVTDRRGNDPGHGINVAPDQSRDPQSANQPQKGNASFYFGLEDPRNTNTISTQPGAANFESNTALYNTYDLPGGALGSLETNSFSLANYNAGEKPTLYFDYYLNTRQPLPQTGNDPHIMVDSARVFISADGGNTWQELATNNPTQTYPSADDQELPNYTSVSSDTGSGDSRQQVQPLFNTAAPGAPNDWRQARIDLGNYAGYSNLKLRFDFSTAGAMSDPSTSTLTGDAFGNFNSPVRGQDNGHEGFYVDDIAVGFAGRGEMVTGATANTSFFTVPQNPSPTAPTQILTGPFQLNIREGQPYGTTVDPLTPDITLNQSFDVNDRLVSGFSIVAPPGTGLSDGETFNISDSVNTAAFEFFSYTAPELDVASTLTGATAAADSDQFTVSDGTTSRTFQLVTATSPAPASGVIPVEVGANDSSATLAQEIAGAINAQTGWYGAAVAQGDRVVIIASTTFTVSSSNAADLSVPAPAAVIPASFPPGVVPVLFNALMPAADVAANIAAAINGQTVLSGVTADSVENPLGGGPFVPTGNRVDIFGANNVSAINAALNRVSVTFANPAITEQGTTAAGQTTAKISRTGSTSSTLTFVLKAIDVTTALPSQNVTLGGGTQNSLTVTIPAGAASTTVTVQGVEQLLPGGAGEVADGTQTVELVATQLPTNDTAVSGTIDVTDAPGVEPQLALSLSTSSVVENSVTPVLATLTRNSSTSNPLTVTLQSLDTVAASVPATVTIPAGQFSTTFNVSPLDNGVINPGKQQTTTILATASGFLSGSSPLIVTDDGDGTIPFGSVLWSAQGPTSIQSTAGITAPENISPNNPEVGAIEAVITDPKNANIVYAGAVNGGIWKTTNAMDPNGPTWTPLTDNMPSLETGALAYDTADSTHNTVIAGIGEFSSFSALVAAPFNLIGLLRTTDGGATWTQLGGSTLSGQNISALAENGNVILAGSRFFLPGSPTPGLFRSTDTGATFTLVSGSGGLPAGPVSDIVEDPSAPNRFFAAILGQGLFVSTDFGATWTNITPGGMTLNTSAANYDFDKMRISLSGSTVYFGYEKFDPTTFMTQLANLAVSPDHGTTWTQLALPTTVDSGTTNGINPIGQGMLHFSMVADPANPNIIYVGGDGQPGPYPNSVGANTESGRLFRGVVSASGAAWTPLTNDGTASDSSPHPDSRRMAFNAAGDIIETDDGGIYLRTSPESASGDWESLIGGGLQITEIHSIAYDTVGNVLLGGTQDNNTDSPMTPGGAVWTAYIGGDGSFVAVDDSNPNQSIRYGSAEYLQGFTRMTFDANNVLLSQAFPLLNPINGSPSIEPEFYSPIALNAINPQRLVIAGQNGIYESFDQGDDINLLNAGAQAGPFPQAMVYGGMLNGQPNADVLWVGTGNQVLLRTTAGGALTATGYSGGNATALTVDPTDWQHAFVTDDQGNVWMTTNGGASFTNITGSGTGSLTSLTANLNTAAFVPGTTSGTLFVGSQDGVYNISVPNSGPPSPISWGRYGLQMPHVQVYSLEYVASKQLLVAGTLGRGAFITSALGAAGNLTVSAATVNGSKVVTDDAGVLKKELTITRTNTSGSLTVTMTSSNTNLATVTPTVTFAAGQATATADVTIVDSALASYPSTVVFSAVAGGFNSIGDLLDISPDGDNSGPTVTPVDNDTPALTVSIAAPDTIQAGTVNNSIVGTVTRNTPTNLPLTVTLLSSDLSAATVTLVGAPALPPPAAPVTITIPAGQASATFTIDAVDHFAQDIPRNVSITAAASGLTSGSAAVTVNSPNHILSYNRIGDWNQVRQQGQVLVADNIISKSLDFGISIAAGPRDASGNLPHQAPPINLPAINAARLAPGTVATNNLIVNNGQGGIQVKGDADPAGEPPGAVPFARIINNTIYGGSTPAGTGVAVSNNASPTIINNIFANLATGVSVDNTSSSTVITGSVYQNDTATLSGASDTFGISLGPQDPLFTNPATGNFYLAKGSQAIDTAINSLADRTAMVTAKSLTGIAPSPILAPTYDLYGQLRVADPEVNPSGVGSTLFKSRGAIDRVDFTGPTVALVTPRDNDKFDQDPTVNVVHDVGQTLHVFAIQITDGNGVGVDPTTVSSSKFVLYRDGVQLQPGLDYFFEFDSNTDTVYFVPGTGVWANGHQYTIAVDNGVKFDPFNSATPAIGIQDLAGNLLQANSATGFTRFDILLANAGGDAPTVSTPPLQTILEHQTLTFGSANGNTISVFNIDAPGNPLQVSLTTAEGTLTLGSTIGLSNLTGNGTGAVSFTAPAFLVDAALNGLVYKPTAELNNVNAPTPPQIAITATDPASGLTGTGTVSVSILQVNDPPIITVNGSATPATQIDNENATLSFNSANQNQLNVTDEDSEGAAEQVTITATHGTFTLASVTGLTFTTGSGINNVNMEFTGTIAAIENALQAANPLTGTPGAFFTPQANYIGAASLTISVDDLGATGLGPQGQPAPYPQTTTLTVPINIQHVNQPPVVVAPIGTVDVNENAPPKTIDLTTVFNDPDTAPPFNEGFPTVTVTQNNNPTLVQVTFSGSDMMLTFGANQFGTATITLTATDQGTTNGVHPTATITFQVVVNKVPQPPVAVTSEYVYVPGTPLSVTAPGVLSKDFDVNGSPLTAVLTEVPSHGKLVLNADGSFVYVPASGFDGEDSFVYAADNGTFRTPATVFLDSTNARWVASMYSMVLERPTHPSPGEVNYWVSQLDQGVSRLAIADYFITSTERRSNIINQLYETYLLRAVDPGGLSYWLQVWAANSGPEQVQAGIIGSPEYYATAGRLNPGLSNDAAWVTELYLNLLARVPSLQELGYWVNVIETGTSRTNVVLGFVTSDEYRLDLLKGWYQEFLHRDIDPAGAQYWLQQMRNGLPQETILAGIVSSEEFYLNP